MEKKSPKEQLRCLAASAWAISGRKIKKAVEIFKDTVKQERLPMPRAPKKMVYKWGKQLQQKGHVRPSHQKAGRKSKLPKEQVSQLVTELLGWRKAGLTAPYPSIRRFCIDNPFAKKTKKAAGCSTKTVWRQLKAEVPSLGRARLRVKPKLKPMHKLKRVLACKRLLRIPLRDLEWVVWVDAKILYVDLKYRHGWIDKHSTTPEDNVLEHNLAQVPASRRVQIRYYAAVNAKVGKVSLIFITGTTGMTAQRDGLNYKVSVSTVYHSQPRAAAIFGLISSSNDCLLSPLQPFSFPGDDAY